VLGRADVVSPWREEPVSRLLPLPASKARLDVRQLPARSQPSLINNQYKNSGRNGQYSQLDNADVSRRQTVWHWQPLADRRVIPSSRRTVMPSALREMASVPDHRSHATRRYPSVGVRCFGAVLLSGLLRLTVEDLPAPDVRLSRGAGHEPCRPGRLCSLVVEREHEDEDRCSHRHGQPRISPTDLRCLGVRDPVETGEERPVQGRQGRYQSHAGA